MGILSNNYLTEGYYMEDEMGGLIKINDNNEFVDALEANKLFYYDGFSITIVNSDLAPKKNRYDDVI
jgi:hypothetical protein